MRIGREREREGETTGWVGEGTGASRARFKPSRHIHAPGGKATRRRRKPPKGNERTDVSGEKYKRHRLRKARSVFVAGKTS